MRNFTLVAGIAALCMISGQAQAGDAEAGKAKFQQFCATCHGPAGAGDGPASAALRPKPRALDDAEWQATVDDDYLKKVIAEGGTAVGLSPMMTPWGHALKGEDLENVVAYIRSLAE
ncbi:MAG TPA: cytochrome c [Gammaproteobacteria bacterium]|nr:cytochrome c [Gammaproteobacteria bacterium]